MQIFVFHSSAFPAPAALLIIKFGQSAKNSAEQRIRTSGLICVVFALTRVIRGFFSLVAARLLCGRRFFFSKEIPQLRPPIYLLVTLIGATTFANSVPLWSILHVSPAPPVSVSG